MKVRSLFDAPSWGTIGAGQSWFLVAALMIFSPAVTFPLLMWCTYAVTVCAAWKKHPAGFWRTFTVLSIFMGAYLCRFMAPKNEEIELDGIVSTTLLVWTVYLGFALAPIALISCIHTTFVRIRAWRSR